ncbi:hypothetical protein Ddye_028174 [Dipteronia dyeriana]|uniref:Protein kinase domain-containing protein n=1 Tax=Dipteronia dyeriana TaxID=168575 RepID=A0AAD9WQW7_9ROSI|nr:hypothetical protein Ddye_028174 [Dipteronia dyeriana]
MRKRVKIDAFYILYKGFMQEHSISVMKFEDEPSMWDTSQCCLNDIAFASQMCHKNVLKFIGCCLETQIPILVFDPVNYDTLAARLYDRDHQPHFEPLLLTQRLKIAMEIANAVSYLHVGFPRPIVFRSIKLSNILFDEEYVAKLFNMTLSATIPEGETHTKDGLKATMGYVAPEYAVTGYFNEKCDVYSFGLLSFQLLTGRHIIEFDDDHDYLLGDRVKRFTENNRFNEIIDLALKCVSDLAEDRPTMVDVAKQLRQLYLTSLN